MSHKLRLIRRDFANSVHVPHGMYLRNGEALKRGGMSKGVGLYAVNEQGLCACLRQSDKGNLDSTVYADLIDDKLLFPNRILDDDQLYQGKLNRKFNENAALSSITLIFSNVAFSGWDFADLRRQLYCYRSDSSISQKLSDDDIMNIKSALDERAISYETLRTQYTYRQMLHVANQQFSADHYDRHKITDQCRRFDQDNHITNADARAVSQWYQILTKSQRSLPFVNSNSGQQQLSLGI